VTAEWVEYIPGIDSKAHLIKSSPHKMYLTWCGLTINRENGTVPSFKSRCKKCITSVDKELRDLSNLQKAVQAEPEYVLETVVLIVKRSSDAESIHSRLTRIAAQRKWKVESLSFDTEPAEEDS
jgi:hypothetical protein